MYGNNDYRGGLYLPEDIETTHPPEQDPNRDFREGPFSDNSAQGSGAFSQNIGRAYHPNATPMLGLGPPPIVCLFPVFCAESGVTDDQSTIRTVRAVSFQPPTPTHGRGNGMRATSSPQLPYGNGPAPNQFIAPDIAALLAKMTLRQDHLDQENQLLNNSALHARITSFESRPALVAAPPPSDTLSDPRIAAAVRKKQAGERAARKERGVVAAPPLMPPVPEIDAPTSDASASQQSAPQTPIYLGSANLPPELRPVRMATQKFVSRIFREVCGVGKKDEWPDPSIIRINEITQEQYLTPNFDGLITDASNQYLISVVARKAEKDLRDVNLRPLQLTASNATLDFPVVFHMAENSFTNFRPQWRRQNNPELAARDELSSQINRWRQRRCLKVDQKLSIVRAFAAAHNLDPNLLIKLLNETHESDEASGPEDNSGESHEAWKARMAAAAGIRVTSRAALAKLEFLEVLGADWRSDEMLVQARARNAQKVVQGTGRSSARIPDLAPWDFGSSVPWLEKARTLPENEVLLADWNTYGNPAGVDNMFFDTLAQIDDNANYDDNADNDDA
ncbi:hypothetical protein MVEN_01441700 [Mycena venus]|uniref:Uncharacterized protein n=1 Tax=Mycena venus TaxID=2733690 RepID=A0A8H6XV80_9AGAR|nr:hypothetical protein MVEN_01441700 [Mycena venus]